MTGGKSWTIVLGTLACQEEEEEEELVVTLPRALHGHYALAWQQKALTNQSEADLASHVLGPGLFEVDERKAKELVDASQGIGHAQDVAGGLREDLEVQHCG